MRDPADLLAEWLTSLDEADLPQDAKSALKLVVERIIGNGFPVILNLQHLGALVGLRSDVVSSMVNAPAHYYRVFTLPKRRGGYRTISAPYPALLQVQRWILKEILSRIPLTTFAHGFTAGRSIVTNAAKHCGVPCLLKIDIEEFFPSIEIARVVAVFRNIGYQASIAYSLASLCCLDGLLPQGAATSPALSNIIAKRLDRRLGRVASRFGLTYTRYADDLTFSGQHISTAFQILVGDILKSEGFALNPIKTVLCRRRGKRVVTGLSVTGSCPTLPRSTKRQLRKEVFYLTTRGIEAHLDALGLYDPIYIDRLAGRLEFWKYVEPNNPYPAAALAKVRTLQRTLGWDATPIEALPPV